MTAKTNAVLVVEEDGTPVNTDSDYVAHMTFGQGTFLLLCLHNDETWLSRAWITYGSRTTPDTYGTPIGTQNLYWMDSLCQKECWDLKQGLMYTVPVRVLRVRTYD